MSILISDVFAATNNATPSAASDGTFSLFMIIGIFLLFYFMFLRPQNKQLKEHKNLMEKLKKGDEVVTSNGILGKITNVDDQYLKVLIAEGVEMTIQRNAVKTILPKGTLKTL